VITRPFAYTLAVHQRYDVALCDRLRRLEQRWQERMRDSARELGMILIDDTDRSIMQLLQIAPRRQDHGPGERIDHQTQKHVIVQEAAQFLDPEPIDVCSPARGPEL
jgi:hypothetical protein